MSQDRLSEWWEGLRRGSVPRQPVPWRMGTSVPLASVSVSARERDPLSPQCGLRVTRIHSFRTLRSFDTLTPGAQKKEKKIICYYRCFLLLNFIIPEKMNYQMHLFAIPSARSTHAIRKQVPGAASPRYLVLPWPSWPFLPGPSPFLPPLGFLWRGCQISEIKTQVSS